MIDTFSLLQKYTGISKYSQSEVITPPQHQYKNDVRSLVSAITHIYKRLLFARDCGTLYLPL